jgi:hypothetical protein
MITRELRHTYHMDQAHIFFQDNPKHSHATKVHEMLVKLLEACATSQNSRNREIAKHGVFRSPHSPHDLSSELAACGNCRK